MQRLQLEIRGVLKDVNATQIANLLRAKHVDLNSTFQIDGTSCRLGDVIDQLRAGASVLTPPSPPKNASPKTKINLKKNDEPNQDKASTKKSFNGDGIKTNLHDDLADEDLPPINPFDGLDLADDVELDLTDDTETDDWEKKKKIMISSLIAIAAGALLLIAMAVIEACSDKSQDESGESVEQSVSMERAEKKKIDENNLEKQPETVSERETERNDKFDFGEDESKQEGIKDSFGFGFGEGEVIQLSGNEKAVKPNDQTVLKDAKEESPIKRETVVDADDADKPIEEVDAKRPISDQSKSRKTSGKSSINDIERTLSPLALESERIAAELFGEDAQDYEEGALLIRVDDKEPEDRQTEPQGEQSLGAIASRIASEKRNATIDANANVDIDALLDSFERYGGTLTLPPSERPYRIKRPHAFNGPMTIKSEANDPRDVRIVLDVRGEFIVNNTSLTLDGVSCVFDKPKNQSSELYGFRIASGGKLTLNKCMLSGQSIPRAVGVYVKGDSSSVAAYETLFAKFDVAIQALQSAEVAATKNTEFRSCAIGVALDDVAKATIENVRFSDISGAACKVGRSASAIVKKCAFQGVAATIEKDRFAGRVVTENLSHE